MSKNSCATYASTTLQTPAIIPAVPDSYTPLSRKHGKNAHLGPVYQRLLVWRLCLHALLARLGVVLKHHRVVQRQAKSKFERHIAVARLRHGLSQNRQGRCVHNVLRETTGVFGKGSEGKIAETLELVDGGGARAPKRAFLSEQVRIFSA